MTIKKYFFTKIGIISSSIASTILLAFNADNVYPDQTALHVQSDQDIHCQLP